MRIVLRALVAIGAMATAALVGALWLVLQPAPGIGEARDVFGFAALSAAGENAELPPLERYSARDGARLAYRRYPSEAARILIFLHGSSYHGAGYHALGRHLSESGAATVVLPNLRGHYQSGRRRGDVAYVGQLEDDLRDLVAFLRPQDKHPPITLGGHSSGGGLAIRFAGGADADQVESYLLLSPLVPTSPAVKDGTAGGWATLHRRRFFGLLALNAVGIRGLNGLPIIAFNKPETYWDGTETLTYSYRLNTSYHPRPDYRRDLRAIGDRPSLLAIGELDEASDAQALASLFRETRPASEVLILSGVNHFGVVGDPAVLDTVASWLQGLP